MKKDKALEIAESVLGQVGGKRNIAKILRCQAHLRFNLEDKSIVNHKKTEAVQGVLGAVRAGGQVQIVIGPEVKGVYNELCELGDSDNTDRGPASAAKKKITLESIGSGILDAVFGSMGPVIPAIVVSAFFKIPTAILGLELLSVIGGGDDLYTLFAFVGDVTSYSFPVTVGYASAEKFNLNPVMGILMGAILIHPTFVGLVGKPFAVYGIPYNVQSYVSSIVPIILPNWVTPYIAKLFSRIVPEAVRSVFASALIIAATLPIALCVFGPTGVFIGQYVVDALFSLEGIAGFVGIGLITTLCPVPVMTDMCIVLITTLLQIFATYGSDGFIAVAAPVSSFPIMGVGVDALFRSKNKEQKVSVLPYGIIVIVTGTSGPTICGICIKYKKLFIGLLAGGFLDGAYVGLTGVIDATLVPSSNVSAALCFSEGSQVNVVSGIIVCVIAFISTTLPVHFFGFNKNEKGVQR